MLLTCVQYCLYPCLTLFSRENKKYYKVSLHNFPPQRWKNYISDLSLSYFLIIFFINLENSIEEAANFVQNI